VKVQFTVQGVPPKKDGANSMWGKPEEAPKIMALRTKALNAFSARSPLRTNIRLTLRAYVGPTNTPSIGDLDNFVTGICDGLQAAHSQARIVGDYDDMIHPSRVVGIVNDSDVIEIHARKIIQPVAAPFYEVELEGDA